MKILVTGGGTAGHINPALSIVSYIKEKHSDAEILYVGNQNSMEERLVPKAGYNFKSVSISGLSRKISPKAIMYNVKTVCKLISSTAKAKKIIKEFCPDFCIGTGGYVCAPIISAATKLKVPCFLHESNSYPGVTVKMLAKKVKAVFLPNEATKKFFDKEVNAIVTGNPVREGIAVYDKQKAREKLKFDDRPIILSYGGSLGSKKLNEVMADFLKRSFNDKKYQHIHGYGKSYPSYKDDLKIDENDSSIRVLDYIYDMPDYFAAADLIISRSGAMSVTEISVAGKASILIPSPNVVENHQYHNAMSLVNENAAVIIEEKDLISSVLMQKADDILKSDDSRKTFEINAKSVYDSNANEKIYKNIMKIMEF